MISTKLRIRVGVAMAATVFLVAACANDGDSDAAAGDTGSDDAAGTTATGPTGEDDASGGAYGGGGGDDSDDDAGTGGDVTVQANNFLFAPRDVEVAAGTEISVRNGNASTPHTFTVEGTELDLEVSPLETETETVELEPGTYDFLCRFHGQMTGTLTVT